MGITVGDIFARFPNFKPENMERLVGSKDYDGRTAVSLSSIAAYQGQNSKELSIFAAGKEKENYTRLLSDTQRTRVNEQIGINQGTERNKNNSVSQNIPMNTSIFNVAKYRLA